MRRKILRLLYFKSKHESVSKVFEEMKILTVHELCVYELIKVVCKSVNIHSNTALFKNFDELINSVQKCTRSSRLLTLQFQPSDQRSILFRSSTEAVNFRIF